jgi:hypothetical protein
MKRKMHHQIQPREILLLRKRQAQAEIRNFLRAVDTYPARAAEEPEVSFRQHLSSFFRTARVTRRENRFRKSLDLRDC